MSKQDSGLVIPTRTLIGVPDALKCFLRVPMTCALWMAFVSIAAFLAPFLLTLALMSKYPHLATGWNGAGLFLLSFGAALGAMIGSIWPVTFLAMRVDSLRDRKRIATECQVGTHVGVSYAEDRWVLRGESAWDRGWLQSSSAGLTFHGYASSFALPRETIRSVNVHDVQTPVGKLAAVRIEWVHGDELSYIILEPRECRSRKEMHSLCETLRAKIEAGNDLDGDASLPLPLATSALNLEEVPNLSKASGADRAIAMAVSFLAFMVFNIVVSLFAIALGYKPPFGIVGGFWVVFYGLYVHLVLKRMKRKGPDAGPEG